MGKGELIGTGQGYPRVLRKCKMPGSAHRIERGKGILLSRGVMQRFLPHLAHTNSVDREKQLVGSPELAFVGLKKKKKKSALSLVL
jgi:hypothetical protein